VGDGVTEAERAQGVLPTEPVQDSTCRVELPQFEGPLDLLLHVITKHELDILDIPIGFITEKYLEYLSLLKIMSIDVASEYLVMAATLAHIKSKMLLPTPPPDQDDGLEDEQEDPRAELVRRLLEYQKYKAAAAELGDRSLLGADVFGRGEEEHVAPEPAPLAQVGVFSLIDAFQRIANRRKIRVDHEIDLDRISITERIGELADLLRLRGPCTIEDLLPERMGISELIITFLALLEMTRLRITRLQQTHPLASLHVALAVSEQEEQKSGQHASNDTEA
jgi:segregation and condensation protein A